MVLTMPVQTRSMTRADPSFKFVSLSYKQKKRTPKTSISFKNIDIEFWLLLSCAVLNILQLYREYTKPAHCIC